MDSIYAQLPQTFNIAAYFLEENLKNDRARAAAYVYQNEKLTYEQVHAYVCQMATLLQTLGIEWENRVALLLPDSPELVIGFWGSIWRGAVPVPINTAYQLDDIAYILQDCRAKVLITTSEWRDRLASYRSPFLQHVVVVDENPSLLTTLATTPSSPNPAETNKDDSAFWLYTSGSTGRPKGVIHLQHDMVVCAELYAKATIGIMKEDLVYSVAKIPFAYGLGNILYFPLAVGAAAVLSDAVNAFDIITDIQRYRPTIFCGIPSVYAAILNVQELAPLDPSSLRLCISAAESLPPSIWYRWRDRFGLEICEGIGTTELLHIFLSNKPGRCRPGSSGKVVPGYTVRVVDESGNSVAPGEVGNLEVGGESLMLGYWNRYKETTQAIFAETMRTGDKYLVDSDGFFYFAGRSDDRFKVQGQWVLPIEIEDVLLQFPGVQDAAVIAAATDNEELSHGVAYLALNSEVAVTPQLQQELKKYSRQKLPHFKVPQHFFFVDTIPRTATGKIDRKRLQVQFTQQSEPLKH